VSLSGHPNILRAALIAAASVLFTVGSVVQPSHATITQPLNPAVGGEGTIPVQIVNGTANADPSGLAGLEVTLHRFFNDESLGTVTSVSDSEGHVQFEGLPTGADYRYAVVVPYQGVEYGSELASFPEASTALPLTVSVYDTTDSDEAIRMLRTHLIFDYVGEGFRVAEMIIIGNDSDRTFVSVQEGGGHGVRSGGLEFALPEGAMGLTFEDNRVEESVVRIEGGFLDTLPVPPGGRQLLLSYALATDGPAYRFARRITYPTERINVLVSDVGAEVHSDLLVEQEPVTAGAGQRYLHLAGQDLTPGTEFVINFEKLPRGRGLPRALPSSESREARALPRQGLDMNLLRWAGIFLAAAGLGFATLGYPMLRERWASDPTRQAAELERARQSLIQTIARLDDRFEAGEIPEAEYQRQRARHKEQLIQVTRRLRG